MGGKKSTYGAEGRGDLLMFNPETLKVVTDPKHPRFDPRVEREIDEAMVASIMRTGLPAAACDCARRRRRLRRRWAPAAGECHRGEQAAQESRRSTACSAMR